MVEHAAPGVPHANARSGWRDIYTKSLDCVHCGLCLPVCPTYRETGREQSSPRGRIYLFRAVAEGRIELGDVVRDEASLCLGCRACETACPSGVQFGAMLEGARAESSGGAARRRWRAGTVGNSARAARSRAGKSGVSRRSSCRRCASASRSNAQPSRLRFGTTWRSSARSIWLARSLRRPAR